jgi:hypothetical protein
MSARQRRRRETRRREHSESRPTRRRLLAAGGLTAGATLAMSGAAHAATQYTVGTLADGGTASDCTNAANTDCSLRRAVEVANLNAGADTVVFRSGLTGSIILTGGQIPVTDSVGIQGPGASQLAVSGYGNSRIFSIDVVTSDDPASISGLTLRNGFDLGSGGAIYNYDSTLTIANSVIRDSYASGGPGSHQSGGGVATHYGSLTITDSTISGNGSYYGGGVGSKYGDVTITGSTLTGNTAYGDTSSSYNNAYGGALWMGSAAAVIQGSTLDHNTATDGGGIYASGRVGSPGINAITVTNSTIAQNHVRDDGGAIWTFGSSAPQPLTVTGSTIVGNSAVNYAGGLDVGSIADPVLQDSIITGNSITGSTTRPDSDDLYFNGPYTFATSFSLIGVPGPYVTQTVPGSVLIGVNPQLGLLANNGGPTQTLLPASTSPVIDKGKSFGLTSDQRGLARPIDIASIPNSTAAGADGADIGAVEVQSVPTTPPATHKKCKKHKKKHHGKKSASSAKKHKKCKKHKKKKK